MVRVEFKLNGCTVRPDQIANQLEKALFKEVENNIRKKLRNVRDPETGARPTVQVVGQSLKNLSFQVSDVARLIEEVKRRLQ